MIQRWNPNKPHRCPSCHTVAVPGAAPSPWRVYTCCCCGVRFARWAALAALLPEAGTVCGHEHGT